MPSLLTKVIYSLTVQPSTLPGGVEAATRFLSFLRPAFEAMCINEFEGVHVVFSLLLLLQSSSGSLASLHIRLVLHAAAEHTTQ